jgi:transposase
VSGLLRNHKLAKHIQDSSFYEFKRQLEYKCQKYNRELVIIDRFYPSSKMCSECGCIKKDLKLSDRVYICPDCGLELDRDLNASINIKNYVGSWRPKLRLVEDVVVDDPIGNNMLKSETPVKQELPRSTNHILE